jgi:CRISPR-associated protein Cmr2
VAAADFYRAAIEGGVGESEKATRIRAIATLLKGADRDQQCFADLDGGVFFEDTLRNERAFPLKGPGQRERLLEALAGLCKQADDKPSPFYALLLMDGDGMGPLLSKYRDKQAEISQALAAFTAQVPGIVRDHNGRLIYAGGDDVFALMPSDQALACAAACRQAYNASFNENASFVHGTEATISAAIEYAHIHTPLGTVVRDAHRLLDEVAKERTGRDAVACRVWKRGGPILTWALPWEKVLATQDGISLTLVDETKRCFQNDRDDPRQFSSKFFYKVRDLFDLLEAEGTTSGLSEDEETAFLAAEYLGSREIAWPKGWTDRQKREEAEKRVRRLLALCREQVRQVDGTEVRFEPHRVRADGALIVRFLAQNEV